MDHPPSPLPCYVPQAPAERLYSALCLRLVAAVSGCFLEAPPLACMRPVHRLGQADGTSVLGLGVGGERFTSRQAPNLDAQAALNRLETTMGGLIQRYGGDEARLTIATFLWEHGSVTRAGLPRLVSQAVRPSALATLRSWSLERSWPPASPAAAPRL